MFKTYPLFFVLYREKELTLRLDNYLGKYKIHDGARFAYGHFSY